MSQKPVSYTHLDVYKRQTLSLSGYLIKQSFLRGTENHDTLLWKRMDLKSVNGGSSGQTPRGNRGDTVWLKLRHHNISVLIISVLMNFKKIRGNMIMIILLKLLCTGLLGCG